MFKMWTSGREKYLCCVAFVSCWGANIPAMANLDKLT